MKRMIRVLILLVMAGVTSASADVLIYQVRNVTKNIGEGVEFSLSTRGYLVWDLANDHFTTIEMAVLSSGRRYQVSDGSPLVARASGWHGREFTTFSSAGGSGGRYYQDYNRGLNARLKIATDRTASYPRTFKGTLHIVNTSVGPRLTDYSRTFVFSAIRTIAANDAAKSEEEVVAELQAELEALGYSDFDSVAAAGQGAASVMTTAILNEQVRIITPFPGGAPPPPPLPPDDDPGAVEAELTVLSSAPNESVKPAVEFDPHELLSPA